MNSKNKEILKTAFISTLPLMSSYIITGIGFGIILKTKGYGIWWAFFMSVCIYAGSMQYLTIELMTGGASLLSAALATLMVNARHLFYGISIIDKYKNSGKKKPYMIYTLTDEVYSLLCQEDKYEKAEDRHKYYFMISILTHIYWIVGCVAGSFLAFVLNFNSRGIDFALTALFVTIFVEQWLSTKKHSYAIIGLVISSLCLIIFGKQNFLIPSMIVILLTVTLLRKKKVKEYE